MFHQRPFQIQSAARLFNYNTNTLFFTPLTIFNSHRALYSTINENLETGEENFTIKDEFELTQKLKKCSLTGDTKKAEEYVKYMLKNKKKISHVSVTLWLNCIRYGNVKKAEEILEWAKKHYSINPNQITLTTLMRICMKSGDLDKAEEWFTQCKLQGVKPNIINYNGLLAVCAARGDLETAEKYTREMIEHYQISPDLITINTLLGICAKQGNVAKAEEYFEMMKYAHLLPDQITFNNLINTFGKAGELEKAEVCLTFMEEFNLSPSTQIFTSLINACSISGNLEKADSFYQQMQSIPSVHLDVVLLNMMVKLCCKMGDVEKAEKYLKEFSMKGVDPDHRTYQYLVQTCKQADQTDKLAHYTSLLSSFYKKR